MGRANGSQGGEKVQREISRDKENNSSVSQLGENKWREAHLQPVVSRCLLTHCVTGASCGWLRNIFHPRSFVVKKNKVENGWYQIVSMIYHFNLVTKNWRDPVSKARAKEKANIYIYLTWISYLRSIQEVSLAHKKCLKERKNNNLVISHGKLSRVKNLIY